MTLQRQIGFWLGSLVVFVVLMVLLRDILLPFVAALALAYLLDPLADRLERAGMGRLAATLVILVVFLLVFVLALVLLVPLLGQQLAGLVERLPGDAAKLQSLVMERGAPWLEKLGGSKLATDAQSSLGNLVGEGTKWPAACCSRSGPAVPPSSRVLAPRPDAGHRLLPACRLGPHGRHRRWLAAARPSRHIRQLLHEMDVAIAGFLRGQALVCLLLGGFYAIGLSLLGVNFGALIGIISASCPSSPMSAR